MFTGARAQARQAFEQNRHLAVNSKEVTESIQHAEDVAMILRQNVVQGLRKEGEENHFSMLDAGSEADGAYHSNCPF